MIATFKVRVLLVIIFILSGLTTHACAEEAIAWVESFTGDTNNYVLVRAGEETPIAVYTDLVPGDEVLVKSEDGSLQLNYVSGETVTVTQTNSPYKVVAEANREPSIVENLFDWLGQKAIEAIEKDGKKSSGQIREHKEAEASETSRSGPVESNDAGMQPAPPFVVNCWVRATSWPEGKCWNPPWCNGWCNSWFECW